MLSYWLVTIGKSPSDCVKYGKKFTPLVLTDLETSFARLRKMSLAALTARSMALLPTDVPAFSLQTLAEKAGPYFTQNSQNLWFFKVAAFGENVLDEMNLYLREDPDRYGLEWVIRNDAGRFPAAWQGPADGVVTNENRFHVFECDIEMCAAPLQIIEL